MEACQRILESSRIGGCIVKRFYYFRATGMRRTPFVLLISVIALTLIGAGRFRSPRMILDDELTDRLRALGLTGSVADSLEHRLGRKVDPQLADVGRLLWTDTTGGLPGDN